MECISSDTNVWIDYNLIGQLDIPFRLDAEYLMFKDTIDFELLKPDDLKGKLIELGLHKVEITLEELLLADSYGSKYPPLTKYDRIALSIAKCRDITLLTGDNAMRKAAVKENVNVMGTIGLLDRLYSEGRLSKDEYRKCLESFRMQNGGKIRLPGDEIEKRLKRLS